MMARTVSLPERIYPTSINSATWTKLDMNYLNEPSPFPEVLKEEEEEGEISKGGKGSSKGMLALPSKPADPVDLYKILKKARSDREKLAYTAQYVVRYPGDFEDLEARLDKYLNLMDYESSRRDFLSVNVWTEGKLFFCAQQSVHVRYAHSDSILLFSFPMRLRFPCSATCCLWTYKSSTRGHQQLGLLF